MSERFKRALWCRWVHRWRPMNRGGWSRQTCGACEDRDYGDTRMDRSQYG